MHFSTKVQMGVFVFGCFCIGVCTCVSVRTCVLMYVFWGIFVFVSVLTVTIEFSSPHSLFSSFLYQTETIFVVREEKCSKELATSAFT